MPAVHIVLLYINYQTIITYFAGCPVGGLGLFSHAAEAVGC